MRTDKQLTRRDALRLSAGSLLAAGLWPGALRAEGTGDAGEFHFVVINDIHYLNDRCGLWLDRVIRQVKDHEEKIEFCLLVGDLVEHGKAEQFLPVREHFKGLGMPTYSVIGNHDYLAQDDRKAYEDLFPDQLNYHFSHRGWQFVALDSSDGQHASGVAVQPPTLRWLDDTFPKLDRKKPLVVFTHLPLGPWVVNRLTNADKVLERFKPYNLRAVFNGHYHALTERRVGQVTLTTNRCCSFSRQNHDGSKEKGYFLCQAREGKVRRTFVEVKPA